MADREDLFKTTAFGGYDKDEVEMEWQRLKDNAYEEKNALKKEKEDLQAALEEKNALLEEKDQKIAELSEALLIKDKELMALEKNIREKYQSYVDNYDTIGTLIYEARVRAKQINQETDADRQRILAEAEEEARKIREDAQNEARSVLEDIDRQIEMKNQEGRSQYEAVQEELSNVVAIFSRVQRQFMTSYKDIQKIVGADPEDLDSDADDAPALEDEI